MQIFGILYLYYISIFIFITIKMKKDLKNKIRILKELSLYPLYLKDYEGCIKHAEECSYKGFEEFIDNSLWWDRYGNFHLWDSVYRNTCGLSKNEIIKNKDKILKQLKNSFA